MNNANQSIPISALQHYAFCPRQCAYIHIERLWQDNYFALLPGERREVAARFRLEQLRGEPPFVAVDGWNVSKQSQPVSR